MSFSRSQSRKIKSVQKSVKVEYKPITSTSEPAKKIFELTILRPKVKIITKEIRWKSMISVDIKKRFFAQ